MKRILIAEDDLTSRTLLEAVLKKWGYEVVATEDGDAAWEALQSKDAPRLAILDWMMPGQSGIDLCRRLRAQRRVQPLYLILLTARGDRVDIVQGLEAGADDYVSKPYDQTELKARIEVGRRMLELLTALARQEKLQGVIEMAGGVCHELNQPLQVVSGYAEMLIMDLPEDDPNQEVLKLIKDGVDRIGDLTRKMMNIATCKSKDYWGDTLKIVDIEGSSGPKSSS
jgi:phosphoserine phosphatase RsbU/P